MGSNEKDEELLERTDADGPEEQEAHEAEEEFYESSSSLTNVGCL